MENYNPYANFLKMFVITRHCVFLQFYFDGKFYVVHDNARLNLSLRCLLEFQKESVREMELEVNPTAKET